MISVVIPALDSADTIAYTLSSIFSGDFPKNLYEVIVVDNGSVDNTVDVASRFPVKVYVCLKRGQGPARNLGIKKACGDIICFTDSDVILPANWLKKISDFLEKHPEVDGVGGPMLPPSNGHKNLLQKLAGEIYYEDQVFPTEITEPQIGGYRASFYSGNCAYRRDVLISVNGFDESLWDGNDIDLCWRVLKKGKCLIFNPHIKVIHIGFASTIRGIFDQQFRWGRINTELMRRYQEKSGSAKEMLKRKLYPYFHLIKTTLLLLSPSVTNVREKQLLKFLHHTTFHLGRLFELAHPYKIQNTH